jgi:hypothetical protein
VAQILLAIQNCPSTSSNNNREYPLLAFALALTAKDEFEATPFPR